MSLLEVMVALVILAVGALGIAGLQARALKGGESSLQRSQAVIAANYMLEQIRANNALAIDTGDDPITDHGNPTINTWLVDMRTSMGEGAEAKGSIACNGGSPCIVTVQWKDSRTGDNETLELRSLL
jgi:type IV pilus assembly protein PilV